MKVLSLFSIVVLLALTSCNKEVITPIQENESQIDLRSGNRNPDPSGGESGGITDPDNESDEEKVRNRKRKAK